VFFLFSRAFVFGVALVFGFSTFNLAQEIVFGFSNGRVHVIRDVDMMHQFGKMWFSNIAAEGSWDGFRQFGLEFV